MPKISVLFPTYNTKEEYLREAIESVLNQTFSDFEFIVLDDCSPDPNVEKVVKSYTDPRIRFYKNEQNMGISKTRNKLMSLAKGDYLAICDHDDISIPTRFEKEIAFLDAHPETGVVGGQIRSICSGALSCYPLRSADIKTAMLAQECVLMHPTCMIRKKVLLENNVCWDEKFSPCEDYKMWADLIDKTMFHNIDEILLEYRDDVSNTTHKQNEKMQEMTMRIRSILRKEHGWILESDYNCVKKRFYLLGIPVFKLLKTGRKTRGYLFEILPVFCIKSKWERAK